MICVLWKKSDGGKKKSRNDFYIFTLEVRYTGGTKNGVKRLSNDYQRYLCNKNGARKERHINRL